MRHRRDPASGAERAAQPAASPGAATTGEFLYRTEPEAAFESAPLVETRVRFDVTGVIARATVTQRFRNPLKVWIEGAYVFPLPEQAAVDHMRMRAGDPVSPFLEAPCHRDGGVSLGDAGHEAEVVS